MRCAKCGCVFDEGLFCPECGTKYDAEAEQKYEAELKRQQEIQEQENQRRREEEEKAKELERQEEKEKRELEKEKAKAEQERLAKERVEKEAEVLKLRKEEAERKAAEEEKAKAEQLAKEEKLARTFNGVEYQTVDEAKAASVAFEEEKKAVKEQKKVDACAIWSMIFGIATWPLTMVIIGEFLTIPAVILGVKALRRKTTKKGFAIAGIVSVVIYVAVIVIGLVMTFNE